MNERSLRFLEDLVNTPTPSGFEAPGQKLWLKYAAEFAETVSSDAYGNAVATFNPGGSPRLMIVGHGDEIGLMVSYISSEGYLYFRSIGGVFPGILKAQRVTIHTASGPVTGVIGSVPPHLMDKNEDEKNLRYHTSEFRYGKYRRTISFDQPIQADEATAEYKNGLLTIKIPKREEKHAESKKLTIIEK